MTLSITTCLRVRSECCGFEVFLVQRGHDTDALTWKSVPCSCGKTYTYEVIGEKHIGASTGLTELGKKIIPDGVWKRCAAIHPQLESMHCWALEADAGVNQ